MRPSGDVLVLAGAAALVLGFVLPCARRADTLIGVCAGQSLVLALAAVWLGATGTVPGMFAVALVVLGGQCLAIPAALRRLAPRLPAEPAPPGPLAVAGPGIVLTVAAIAATASAGPPLRAPLGLALATALLGVLGAVVRRGALAQTAGVLAAQNGVALALVASGEPALAGFAAALLLPAGALAGLLALRFPPPAPKSAPRSAPEAP